MVDVRLILVGAITVLPLLFFASGARRIHFSHVGFIHFLTPTIYFVIARWVLHEPFQNGQWVSFGIVWSGVILFIVDLFLKRQQGKINLTRKV